MVQGVPTNSLWMTRLLRWVLKYDGVALMTLTRGHLLGEFRLDQDVPTSELDVLMEGERGIVGVRWGLDLGFFIGHD
jgi:hypothetical protein